MSIPPPPSPSGPWQTVYGAAHRLRRRYYGRRQARLPRPVVSVGNLSWGGSGKTPLTAAIATHLRDAGLEVAILSRGYGRKDHEVRIVSRGQGPLLGPRLAGDEPVLLAGLVPGAAVVVAPERYRAGLHALERLDRPPDVFVLDDGFSHLRLARDLDLLTFPAADPFAGGRLPPSGRLREPMAAAAHADAVLLTGAAASDTGADLAAALRRFGFTGPGFVSRTLYEKARRLTGEPIKAPARVVAVAAIARPDAFFNAVRGLGFEIVEELRYPDHHRYPAPSLDAIHEAFRRHRPDVVLTTAKDLVKLQGRIDEPLAELPIRVTPEPGFFTWLDERLAALRTTVEPGGSS